MNKHGNKHSSFLFNLEGLSKIKTAAAEQIVALLAAGSRFQGTGWSTGKACKVVRHMTGIGLVKSSIDPYLGLWLFTIALVTDV